jgi:hypothetical protein
VAEQWLSSALRISNDKSASLRQPHWVDEKRATLTSDARRDTSSLTPKGGVSGLLRGAGSPACIASLAPCSPPGVQRKLRRQANRSVSQASNLLASTGFVRLAEDAVTTPLLFMRRGIAAAHWEGVAMARYGKTEDRVHCIRDGAVISRGLTRYGFATILLLGAPTVFLAAAQAPTAPQAPAVSAAPQPPQAPPPPARDTARVTRYLIVSVDSSSGSWDSRDEPRFKEWRCKYGSHYAWFRQEGRDYIVNDEHTLAELQHAMAPQLEVNHRQDEVNRHQADVNRLQEGVNSHQADVNREQAEVNRQQNLVNQGTEVQSHVNQVQSEVNGRQHAVNAEQDKVNQRQAIINKEQDAVNQMQTRASAEIDEVLQAVFDSARRQGVAHEVH